MNAESVVEVTFGFYLEESSYLLPPSLLHGNPSPPQPDNANMNINTKGYDTGSAAETNFVNMGCFGTSVVGPGKRYLKSTGFGSCIGVVFHLSRDAGVGGAGATVQAGLLAHFMSDNAIEASYPSFLQRLRYLEASMVPGPSLLGMGGIPGADWTACIFHGDAMNGLADSKTAEGSRKLARKRAQEIRAYLQNTWRISTVDYVKDPGFKSVVLDVQTGHLLLFDGGVAGSEAPPSAKDLFRSMGKPLTFNGK